MDERKLKILAAVVDEYILTGEPVGSKAISQVPGINVSAATMICQFLNSLATLNSLIHQQDVFLLLTDTDFTLTS